MACGIADGCGLTKALDEPGAMETPHQRFLYAMAGMVLAGEFVLLNELRRHATEPDYIDPMSDSRYIVEALPHIDGDPAMVLSQFTEVILRLGNRFRKAHNQAARQLRVLPATKNGIALRPGKFRVDQAAEMMRSEEPLPPPTVLQQLSLFPSAATG